MEIAALTDPSNPALDPSDAQLVGRARGGDVDAFSELVRRHQRPLMAKAMSSTRNVADADDLVQEAFMRAFRSLAKVRDASRFGPWLHRVLANLLADRGRRSGREPLSEEALPTEPVDGDPGPERRLLAREIAASLRSALEALPSGRQKEVFRMRYVDGLPVQEIATRLGVHSGTVKVHLFRTSQKLREVMGTP